MKNDLRFFPETRRVLRRIGQEVANPSDATLDVLLIAACLLSIGLALAGFFCVESIC